jgi:hypothetical protein
VGDSDKLAHEALVSEQDFVAAQKITTRTQPADGGRRTYLLTGMLRCATCRRSMDPSPGTAIAPTAAAMATPAPTPAMRRAANLYLREDVILGRIFAELHTLTSRDAGTMEEIARLLDYRDAADLTTFLRAQNIIIECGEESVSIEPDPEKPIIVSSPTNHPHEAGRVPRQQSQQQKQERGIA